MTNRTTRRHSTASLRGDTVPASATAGLTNARTRLVGERTGILADLVVLFVRAGSSIGRGVAHAAARLSSVVTPLGWVMAGLIPLAFLIGYLLGWAEFVAIAWASVVLVLVALLYIIGRTPYQMTLSLPHRRVVVGESAVGTVTVGSRNGSRVPGSKLEIPIGSGLVELVMPSVRRDAEVELEFPVPTVRRGIVPVGPVRTIRADPIGLVRRVLTWTDSIDMVVHPRTIAVPSSSTGLIRDLEGAPTRDLTSSDVAFHALREYQTGDERRLIHWKSTAKTGVYMVRQFEQSRRSHLVVALSLAVNDYRNEAEFELAVSAAGSLGVRAIRDGRTVSVVVSSVTPQFAKRRTYAVRPLATHLPSRLLDDLAVVEPSDAALGIRDMARIIADDLAGISVAFLVCGSLPGGAELRAASAAYPLDVAVVAVVCDPEAIPGLRKVAGLSVLTIGYLEELRLALARTAAVA